MQFNVAQLLKEPVGSTRSYTLDEAIPPLVGNEPGKVTGHVNMLRTDRAILVSATLATAVTCDCSRCLEPYRQPIAFSIEEEFLPIIDINTGAPLPLGDDRDNVFTIDENHILDLQEAVHQYIVINLPMKPLCNLECRGICPQCGTTRRAGYGCSCEQAPEAQLWSPLRDLLPHTRA